MDPTASGPAISVTTPVETALAWTKRVLFQPFDIEKWFVLGFCAWLAWLGQSGGSGGGNFFSRNDAAAQASEVLEWIRAHMGVVIVLAAIAFALVLALLVVVTWLTSRGQLMFVDGVVRNRGAVAEPWARFRNPANSLFEFRLIVGLMFFGASLLLSVPFALGLYGLSEHWQSFGPGAALLVFAWVLLLLPLMIAGALFRVAVTDFVVPIQWLRGCTAMEAWRELRALARGRFDTLALYVLMKIVIVIAMVVLTCAGTCLTCCCTILPYIGTVILLPLYVFHRTYSLHFLSQFGPVYHPLGAGGVPWVLPPPPPLNSSAGAGSPS